LQATWIGAAIAVGMTETIGLLATAFPGAWLTLFNSDPAMLAAGTQYLHAVGPLYGFFGLALILYFASQGAGRLLWPALGNVVRLLVAALGGWLALRWGGGLLQVFIAQGVALVIYGSSTPARSPAARGSDRSAGRARRSSLLHRVRLDYAALSTAADG
jgi:Na+-driven multidrug efflux pump